MKEAIDIIKQLNENNGDSETAHANADLLLLDALRIVGGEYGNDIADAYEACEQRIGFWYA
jgi:hypothetical protein